MIPITKPSLDNSDYKHIKKVLKSKILTDGYFQQKTEILLKKSIKSKLSSFPPQIGESNLFLHKIVDGNLLNPNLLL